MRVLKGGGYSVREKQFGVWRAKENKNTKNHTSDIKVNLVTFSQRLEDFIDSKPPFSQRESHRKVRGLTPGSLSGGENAWTIRRSLLREERTGRLPGCLRKLGEDCLVLLLVWREGLDYPPVASERGEYREVTRTPEEARRGLLSTSGGMERTAGLSAGRLPGEVRVDSPIIRVSLEYCDRRVPGSLLEWKERLDYPPVVSERGEYREVTRTSEEAQRGLPSTSVGMERTVGLSAGRLPGEVRVDSPIIRVSLEYCDRLSLNLNDKIAQPDDPLIIIVPVSPNSIHISKHYQDERLSEPRLDDNPPSLPPHREDI
ncbi:hypothetical protein WH47_01854 [Habropoda laboriosa]|uniref:Uncharacterized protein n=1 Tax=Habropoda laboriosa TaxID=597456 RepID=A0A0L7QTS0_9HYME|nr:hypothetical protein WH47_01854 [Habropoda laboriosa]